MANVLIIDDDEDVGHLLETQLTEEGHSVTVAHQGDEGMAKMIKSPPDLIMLDVFLPDATGFQICSLIRKNATTKTVPIIMMTGAARFPSQHMFGIERGANEYISKPFDLAEVGELINKYIGGLPKSQTAVPQQALSKDVESALEPLADEMMSTVPYLSLETPEGSAPLYPAPSAQAEKKPGETILPFPLKKSLPPAQKEKSTALDSFLEKTGQPTHGPTGIFQNPLTTGSGSDATPSKGGKSSDEFVPALLASKERFIDFGMEIYALAAHLSSNPSEKFLADHLLRSSLSVGVRIAESRAARSPNEFNEMLQSALKDLRETSHWLMIARKAGVLDILAKSDLEKTCQSLLTLLSDFLTQSAQQYSSR